MPVITSQWPGKCAACGKPYAEGLPIYYDRKATRGKKCYHVECMPGKAPTPQQAPLLHEPETPDTLPAGVHFHNSDRSASGAPLYYVKADSLAAMHAYRASVRDLANAAHHAEVTPESRPNGTGNGAPRWWGVGHGTEARRILDSGEWPEGVARMLDTLGKIQSTAQPTDSRRRRRWADNGDHVEMSRVWAGRVDVAWSRCTRQSMRAPAPVTIAVNLSQACNEHAERLFWRGAAAMLLADALTDAGYNVEIECWYTGTNFAEKGKADCAIGVTVKDARSPLDLNALAVTCAFGGYFRSEIFQAVCALPRAANGGLGTPHRFRDVVTTATDPRTPIICEGITDAESARRWIAEALAQIEGKEAIAA